MYRKKCLSGKQENTRCHASDGVSTPSEAWHRRPKFRRVMRKLAILVIATPFIMYATWQAAVAWWPVPAGFDRPPAHSTIIEDRDGRPLAAFVSTDGQWQIPLTIEQISPHLIAAVLAVEDSRFYQHTGVDWHSVAGACWQDVCALHIVRGASTVSMQVARLRDPKPRSMAAKFVQAVRACQLEKHISKQEILTEYLNRAPFGGNLVGAGAASWRYFGRPCRDLSLGQAALLAGLPQSPNRYRPDLHAPAALARRNHVLDRMLACGIISQKEYAEAQAEVIDAKHGSLPQDRPHDRLIADGALPALSAIPQTAPVVRVTLDARVQHLAAQLLADSLRELQPSGVTAGAIVVLDTPTAQALALVSQSKDGGNIDLTRRPRSTGSTLKPFIYAAAFDEGICSPSTILQDTPKAWPGYVPSNYDREFRGPMKASEALAQSRNIPAMLVLEKVGIERAVGLLQSAGFHTLAHATKPYGLALAIGGAEATPLEIAQAYATLARGGRFIETTILPSSIHNADHTILPAQICWQTLAAINGTERTSHVCTEAAKLNVAWKTGTSSDHRDAWCAAVTPRRTVVVWLGNLAGPGASALVGQEATAPVALKLIAAIDPGGPAWPHVEEPPETPAPVAQHTPKLHIVTPTDSQEIILRDKEPADQQRVFLSCAGGSDNSDRWWFVDDHPLTTAGNDVKVAWAPVAGRHTVRVVDDAGHSASVTLRVRSTPN